MKLRCSFYVLFTGFIAASLSAAEPSIRLVSTLPAGSVDCRSGNGGSFLPSFSGNGRFLLFVSNARNLVTNDDCPPYLTAYVRELATGNTILASIGPSERVDAAISVRNPTMSSDGQLLGFVNIYGTNRLGYAYVRDLRSNATITTSIYTNDSVVSANNSLLSGDARWLFFETQVGPTLHIFARDLVSNGTEAVDVGSVDTSFCGNCGSTLSSVSPDGRYVAYVSSVSNQFYYVTNRGSDLYVRDMQSSIPIWASTNVAEKLVGYYYCFNAVVSADGSHVAFWARAYSCLLLDYDLKTHVTSVIASNWNNYYSPVQISTDGRFVAYDDQTNIWVWDNQEQTNILVNVNRDGTGPGNNVSKTAAMTPDGKQVAFVSAATDLVTNNVNGSFQVYVRDLVAGTTRLVSANTNGIGTCTDLESIVPAISPDGSKVAFDTAAADLVPGDLNKESDVFVRDLANETTTLISERAQRLPAPATGTAFSTKSSTCISSNAHWIAFSSMDGRLVPNDTNEVSDVFVRDLESGAIQCAGLGNWPAGDACISADGRYVAFTRQETNGSAMSSMTGNIYRYGVQSGTLDLVSVQTNGLPAGLSSTAAISPDGRYVAFQSMASGLDIPGTPIRAQIYVRDMQTGLTKLASTLPGAPTVTFWNGYCRNPIFSSDGRWMTFWMEGGGVTWMCVVRNMLINSNLFVGPNIYSSQYSGMGWPLATFSADSRYLAIRADPNIALVWDLTRSTNFLDVACNPVGGTFIRNPIPTPGARCLVYERWDNIGPKREIVLFDTQTMLTNLISVNKWGTAGGNGFSSSPQITPDAQFVVFASKASDLVEGDTNGVSDIFVRDRLRNITVLVSVNAQGQPGNGPSTSPVLAGDGRTVIFQSFAGDLVEGDYNGKRDLFVLRLGAGDSDGDGLDDDWEMAYFNTLARDGTGDFDNDGLTEKQEFLAGTDPINNGSVLRGWTVAPVGGGHVTILWPAAPGRIYKVQYRDRIEESGWHDLPGTVNANGSTGSMVDTNFTAQPQRFYRIRLQN